MICKALLIWANWRSPNKIDIAEYYIAYYDIWYIMKTRFNGEKGRNCSLRYIKFHRLTPQNIYCYLHSNAYIDR